MPKEFYTERDIEDLARRGVTSLEVNDNVVLTELAYEKAHRLGVRLVTPRPDNPPSAPIRPYISQSTPPAQPARASQPAPIPSATTARPAPSASNLPPATPDLQQRIRQAVIARLGSQVDSNLLDVIIQRVLNNVGVK